MNLLWHSFSLCLLACCLLASCAPLKPVSFQSVSDLKVKDAFTSPTVSANLDFFNPNPVGCTIKSLDVTVALNKTTLTQVSFPKHHVPSNKEFALPLNAAVSYSQLLKLIPAAIAGSQSGKEIPIDLTGSVSIRKFIFSKTFPLEVHQKLNLKDIQLN